jgi:hypothetical protein
METQQRQQKAERWRRQFAASSCDATEDFSMTADLMECLLCATFLRFLPLLFSALFIDF